MEIMKRQKKCTQLILAVCTFCITSFASAVDLADKMSSAKKVGYWQVLEFAGGGQIGYRLATTAILNSNITMVFDFLPSNKCISEPTVIIIKYDSYKEEFNDGLVLMEYKFPRAKKQTTEAIKTVMAEGDSFVFMPFQKLTTDKLYRAGDKGKLAVWFAGGHDYERSDNIYFSLEGFMRAYQEAKKSCSDNMAH